MYRLALSLSVLALAACQPQVPDSGWNGSYGQNGYGQGGSVIGGPAVTAQPLGTSYEGARPRADTIAGIASVQSEAVHYTPAGVSDEQSFDAVASRESIASDAERIRRQREQYVVVQPTALPQRGMENRPNIVGYALATSHLPGTQMFSRSSFRLRPPTSCGSFTSADLAQEAFLAQGGPQRDSMGLDPDGDGFVCGWDPRPFRAALHG